ncbi:MAG: methylated-DNA--[protein]-cysteine S-methyltransferase [Xanthomonadales bacterium]|nr:methylated-DNA--[protein]-cysteine S-methyltransferase [Gammaproteobacteria bacterium]MBT8050577.1 methylated-DNA--[protein]-cysteine S-methyltransferase [Gammaproteobacteria bacterium]NNJ80064.1 methylated-DNA--[protein]-cysteine S-methyltransferase [Xanthomonadales bacterium]NNL04535.1 methylated-DNA--[protein]-cysteine S-methyltransferase [Xanthomonadales bacterium]
MSSNSHYRLVESALKWIAENQPDQPDLTTLSRELSISPGHLQRVFQAWAGVSPKRFLMSLTRQSAMERLAAGETVLEASMGAGLSGPGRLHDLLITTVALTPGEIRQKGRGISLRYGFGESPFGEALVGWHQRGIHFLGFRGERSRHEMLTEMSSRLEQAILTPDEAGARERLSQIFEKSREKPLRLWLRGSPFQLQVWEALLAIPDDALSSYGQIARMVNRGGAAQAVGKAVGSNPVAWIIPCHRVIRGIGELGGYRWGLPAKQAMIGMDAIGFRSRSA